MIRRCALALAAAFLALPAAAQDAYPSRTITMTVPFAAGGEGHRHGDRAAGIGVLRGGRQGQEGGRQGQGTAPNHVISSGL